ncbi:aminotransferase class III-fold pyridoxal phosphate-dependent enzyme [Blastococcus sp. VKM Ac-2987]|uniref:aminotransferase class III-fold pyridoxal phosphate-dependent enzyme n=1 Tax=Blastococcus sp. VKM Ac-2987 TaxID=3004141 RepID=UPI0022ABAB80|nr:aminotransferase class III-fold pyridoxal phosphate-dependent enzyme [Blastococcus sp. VKM Ac-2987]MCZ2859290.1 aminotransferase class III-fold pyridoxal phosphate-dependent enzyme [Blastococcus sp. VKM Ac-2987]
MTQVLAARTADAALRTRASSVIPGGMYGHMNVAGMPDAYPQFMTAGEGSRLWDADGNEYIDFMCGWGPVVLGRKHPGVEAAVRAQLDTGDLLDGPSPVMVDLAELLVDLVPHADWAMLAKNGTDATTACVTIARAATGRRKILIADGAYHGAIPWCTPKAGGVLAEDRAHLGYFEYNDVASLEAAVAEAGDDLAGIIVAPARQELARDQEMGTAEFARAIRAICDRTGAVMILDDVRCGFRLDLGGSWEPYGVQPDLAAWSKAIANGYSLAAITGRESLRQGATGVYVTGSFWYSAVSMAASIATLTALRDTDALARMADAGRYLRDGLTVQAAAHGFVTRQTGPVQMPLMRFADDTAESTLARIWTNEAVKRGVYLHPVHNWFVCAAHTREDIDQALQRTDDAFAELSRLVG